MKTIIAVHIALIVAVFIGWVFNLLKLSGTSLSTGVDVELILRAIGVVVFPLGAVMGYFVA